METDYVICMIDTKCFNLYVLAKNFFIFAETLLEILIEYILNVVRYKTKKIILNCMINIKIIIVKWKLFFYC